MALEWFPIALLGVWRITHLLAAEDGPAEAMIRVRAILPARWATALDCFYCTSSWVALPFALALADGWAERLLLWPALSGGAILLERVTGRVDAPAVAAYVEHVAPASEIHRDLLRR
jgi:hypothetical protein